MKNYKKLVAVLMTLVMVFAFTACGGDTATENSDDGTASVEFTLAHIRPEGSSADLAVRAFCDEVTEATGGSVTFDVYPAAQLGDYSTVFERVIMGDVDISFSGVPTSVDKALGILNMPYLASTWTEAYNVFGPDSFVEKESARMLENIGITSLGVYPFYFGGIALGVDPVDPTNPDAKSGIKIRVPSLTSFEKTAEALGYLATPLASTEIFTSMQTHVIDGALGMGAEGYYSNLGDMTKYYIPINDHFECWILMINSDKFNSLTAEQQDAFRTAARNMNQKRWEVAEDETKSYESKLAEEYGVKVVDFTDSDLEAFGEKVRTEVWPYLVDDFGEEIYNKLIEEFQ